MRKDADQVFQHLKADLFAQLPIICKKPFVDAVIDHITFCHIIILAFLIGLLQKLHPDHAIFLQQMHRRLRPVLKQPFYTDSPFQNDIDRIPCFSFMDQYFSFLIIGQMSPLGLNKIFDLIDRDPGKQLGIVADKEVTAVIKATSVMMANGKLNISARNQLTGTVSAINEGAVNAIVKLDVAGGIGITSTISMEAVKDLGLEVGKEATAIIKATSVMISA